MGGTAAGMGGIAGTGGVSGVGGAPTGPSLWRNATILGGGFVSGIVFSPVQSGLVYARTDIGGFYRWDGPTTSWVPLTDGLPYNQMGGESLAADPVDANVVYAAGGMYLTSGNGVILRSGDRGNSWTANPIAVPMGGNADGRSMGERLAVDPNSTSTLYFGSRTMGLWRSANAASTWARVTSFPVTGNANIGLGFVLFDEQSGSPGAGSSTIYVGVAATGAGSNLYRSSNAGTSWTLVAGGPTGLAPHHAVIDSTGVIYLAYNNGMGPNGITAGAVWRYDPAGSGAWTAVTPPSRGGGFGGVTLDPASPGTVIVSTLDWWNPDEIYRTTNGGGAWTAIGRTARHLQSGAEYLCWGRPGCTDPTAAGWMGDIEIDPFNPAHVMFVTGQGVWSSDNADGGTPAQIAWTFVDRGLEETAVLDMTSSVAGALLSAVGDIAGFRHVDLTQPSAIGMYSNPVFGNTTGIDFAAQNPLIVARVGTVSSSSTGRRGAYSSDNGQTWTPFGAEVAGSSAQGAIAVSADGATLVWAPSNVAPAYSRDRGASWTPCAGLPNNLKVASDRVNPNKFYAYAAGASTPAATAARRSRRRPRGCRGTDGRARCSASKATSGSTPATTSTTRRIPAPTPPG